VVDACHGLGIRVIVDGVFNHTGRDHFAAQDVVRNGRQSQYWDWYRGARELPGGGGEIPGWEGHAGLPQLNHQNPDVRAHIMDCGRFWMSPEGANIDGWRLDVAHEVAPDFWREFNQACRGAKPDCALLGELMHGDYNTHVGPGLLDSGTNYQLSKALWSSLNDHNYWELAHSYGRDKDMYGNLTMLNFLGNHDQMRIHSRLNDPNAHYPLAVASMILGRGVPCLYYGDELGEQGKPGGPEGDLAMRREIDLRAALNDQKLCQNHRGSRRAASVARGASRRGRRPGSPGAHQRDDVVRARRPLRRRRGRRVQQLGPIAADDAAGG
jgi:glycosidase